MRARVVKVFVLVYFIQYFTEDLALAKIVGKLALVV